MNRRQFLATTAALAAATAGGRALAGDRRTGYVFHPVFLQHDFPEHPEGAYRLRAINDHLRSTGLLERLQPVPARIAPAAEIKRLHGDWHVDELEMLSRQGDSGHLDPYNRDNYYTPATWEAACRAVGGLTDLCLAVADGRLDNGFAFVRPPGHHAEQNRAMGFCYFGNASLAATTLLERADVERVAIVDFDIHHGNGTQALVGANPACFFADIHERNLFPPASGPVDATGEGAGRGSVLNAPLPRMVGDTALAGLTTRVLAPALDRFDPQFIIVSAGYDGHWRDPLSHQALTLGGFDRLSRELIGMADELCDGRIVFTLEGGYDAEALGTGVGNTVRALLGERDHLDPIGPGPEAEADLGELVGALRDLHGLKG